MKIDNASSLNDDNIKLIDIIKLFFENKRYIFGVPIFFAILTAGASFLIANQFTGKAQILPPQSAQAGAGALLGQLGALSGLASGSLGLKNPNDMYVAMLNSRTIADKIINQFKLSDVYGTKLMSQTRNMLAQASNIVGDKSGIIIIEVVDKDPARAAALTNAYVTELQNLTQFIAVTEASQRRLFIGRQLALAKQDLINSEVALKEIQEKTGIIQLNGQAAALIKYASDIKAQIAAKEIVLGTIRTFATENNPEYIRTQQELKGLRQQLQKIETGTNAGNGDISVSTSKAPELSLEYIRKMRDVKYYETMFELLAKQFEIAKIEEAKDSSIIQVLDSAIIPDRKSKPNRAMLVLAAALISGFLTLLYIFLRAELGKKNN